MKHSVHLYQNTQCHISEDINLYGNHVYLLVSCNSRPTVSYLSVLPSIQYEKTRYLLFSVFFKVTYVTDREFLHISVPNARTDNHPGTDKV